MLKSLIKTIIDLYDKFEKEKIIVHRKVESAFHSLKGITKKMKVF